MDWFIPPPLIDKNRESSYHLFPLRIKKITEAQRDQIIDEITSKGIAVNVHFIPLPMLTYFKGLGYKMSRYPSAHLQYTREISLPIYPQLSDIEVDYIIDTVIEAVNKHISYSHAENMIPLLNESQYITLPALKTMPL
jgi:dTDP-4-amino-4,6-dideoxygalactose transaminase